MSQDYLSAIYNQTEEIDPQLAAAGEFLSKVAEEEGMDLDSYSDEEIGAMLNTIMSPEEGGEGGEGDSTNEGEGEGESQPAAEGGEGEKTSQQLTVADVAGELAKQAAAEGVDLTKLSREQLHEAYNYVHQTLTDPAIQQQKLAMEEKVAEADMLGRVMAHSFDNELRKIAAEGENGEKKDEKNEKEEKKDEKEEKKEEKMEFGEKSAAAQKLVARALRSKLAQSEQAVLQRARELAKQAGYNPDTGERVTSDLDTAALNLLKQNGYDI